MWEALCLFPQKSSRFLAFFLEAEGFPQITRLHSESAHPQLLAGSPRDLSVVFIQGKYALPCTHKEETGNFKDSVH